MKLQSLVQQLFVNFWMVFGMFLMCKLRGGMFEIWRKRENFGLGFLKKIEI